MKLYNVPRGTWIRLPDLGEVIYFHHIDGMYSLCETADGKYVHVRATLDVVPIVRAFAPREEGETDGD